MGCNWSQWSEIISQVIILAPDPNLQGYHMSGKVREKQNFLQVREKSGNFEKMSGNLAIWPMSGNCQEILSWQINIFWKQLAYFLVSEGKLSVMHSLKLECKFLCQNSVVHPKLSQGVSTEPDWKLAITNPAPPPPQAHMEFGILADLDSTKVWRSVTYPPGRNGTLGF